MSIQERRNYSHFEPDGWASVTRSAGETQANCRVGYFVVRIANPAGGIRNPNVRLRNPIRWGLEPRSSLP